MILDSETKINLKYLYKYLSSCQNGKRLWIDTRNGLDYSVSTSSTYPEYTRFYFEKTPKRLRSKFKPYGEYGLKGIKPWHKSYYNGNRRELLNTIKNASEGKLPKSERMIYVLETIYESYMEDYLESIF